MISYKFGIFFGVLIAFYYVFAYVLIPEIINFIDENTKVNKKD